jgi:hypothetical protein
VSAHSADNVSNAIVRYSNNTGSQTFAACLNLAKSNTTTAGTHVAVVDEQLLGSVSAFGSDGTNFVNSSAINFGVDGAVAAGSVPGHISFSTRPATSTAAPSTRMRITNAGNVGIANTSPTERLHVTGNIKASGVIDAGASFQGQASDSAGAPSYTWTGDTDTGMFRPAADTIAFSEGGSEVMRINSTGSVSIGTATEIDVTTAAPHTGITCYPGNIQINAGNDRPLYLRRNNNASIAGFYRGNVEVGTISVTTTATAYNTSSDYRLKQNVEPLVGGLAKLAQLKPSTFEFKSEPDVKVDGFIAHEVQEVVPIAVTGEKDGDEMQGLDHSKLVPVLVAAVQELSAKVAALEAA